MAETQRWGWHEGRDARRSRDGKGWHDGRDGGRVRDAPAPYAPAAPTSYALAPSAPAPYAPVPSVPTPMHLRNLHAPRLDPTTHPFPSTRLLPGGRCSTHLKLRSTYHRHLLIPIRPRPHSGHTLPIRNQIVAALALCRKTACMVGVIQCSFRSMGRLVIFHSMHIIPSLAAKK